MRSSVGNQTGTAFTAIVAVIITEAGLTPALEGAQRDPDFAAGTYQTRASGMGLANQLDHLPPVQGTGQPSASSEQKASHFFCSSSKVAISAMAFSLRCNSFLRALISRWS